MSDQLVGQEPTIHELKCWTEYFWAVVQNIKHFEIRKMDRDFKVGDILKLREYNPDSKTYTGPICFVRVEYIFSGVGYPGDTYLQDGVGVMSLATIRYFYQNDKDAERFIL